MQRTMSAVAISALVGVTVVGAASASESYHMHRHARHAVVVVNGDSRDAVAYYPGWGRDPVMIHGVYPGLVYGGAMSAPAKR